MPPSWISKADAINDGYHILDFVLFGTGTRLARKEWEFIEKVMWEVFLPAEDRHSVN